MIESRAFSPATADVSARRTAIVLTGLVLLAFAVRMWLLHGEVSGGTFTPPDLDGYLRGGSSLARNGAGWEWTLDAIRYPYSGRIYLLPPLYPVFLSVFARSPAAFPYSAAVAQIAVNALSIVPLFVIAATLHSRRAGLIAAFVYALWMPNIWTFAQFMQEQLYVPLLLVAFALFVRATARNSGRWAFAAAGVAFGCAALTRSMPLYYLIPAAIGYVAVTRRDPAAVRRAGALLAGFLIVTGAYSIWLSSQVGHVVFIENHGGITVHEYRAGPNYRAVRPPAVPSLWVTVLMLVDAFWFDPGAFVHRWLGYAGALFHVHGDRWLHYYTAATATGASIAKVIAHATIDLPFIACVVLAPLGAVLARRRQEAALLVLWIVVMVAASALSAAGGVRYRSPLEPHLIALAAVVPARGWRRPGRVAWIAGTSTAVAAAIFLAAQLPRVARAKANYGLDEWITTEPLDRASARGKFGLNVLPHGGIIELRVRSIDPVSEDRPTRISVRIDDRHVGHHLLVASAPIDMRYPRPAEGLAYLEMSATDIAGNPARVEIELRDRR